MVVEGEMRDANLEGEERMPGKQTELMIAYQKQETETEMEKQIHQRLYLL